MVSIIDSEAHFTKRSEEVGLSDAGRRSLSRAGYTTLGRLAFAVGQPGTPLVELDFNNFATNVLGGMASMQDISSIKRLLFESQTMVLANLREQVTSPDALSTKKMPAIEREAKMRNLKARLPGVLVEKQLEPSHSLLNLVAQMWEAKQLTYIPIEKLTSREHEVLYSKASKQLSLDPDKLLVKEENKVPDQTATSELQVLEALKRRGIAFDCCDCMSWNAHERYLQCLFGHLRSEPPEGFSRPTLQQVLRADRQAFLVMIRQDTSVRRDAFNTLPMDTDLMAALQSYEVGFNLMPLPKTKAPDTKVQTGSSKDTKDGYGPTQNQTWSRPEPYGKGGKGKGKNKGKKPTNILPKELQNRGCVGVDDHNRRLCFNFNLDKCQAAANGSQCNKGFHLCMKKGCHAPHSVIDHEKQHGKNAWKLGRVESAARAGAGLQECLIVEIFAGTGRVTAALRQCGMRNCFGVDKLRVKGCVAPLATVDLCDPRGQQLLWQWLESEYVIGIFMAPPCGSASRARAIPLRSRARAGRTKKFLPRQRGPRPLRSDLHPNGLPNLTESEQSRISIANQLYHLTSKLVRWASDTGVIFVVENPQFSLFWATTFWTEVAHLAMYATFHSCQYGSSRKKKTMFASNALEFLTISAKCPGQNSKHKHARWGFNRQSKTFATADETAYPMGLAKLIAVVFTRVCLRVGIQIPPETLDDLQPWSLDALQKIKAQTGLQPKSSRLPPLVRTYKTKLKLRGHVSSLPQFSVLQRTKTMVRVCENPVQILPKGSRLLAIDPGPKECPSGEMQNQGSEEPICDVGALEGEHVHVQLWGTPWSPDEFVFQAVKAGHPSKFKSFLPSQLAQCVERYFTMNVAQRTKLRVEMLKYWMKRLLQLRDDEKRFHETLHCDVESVLKTKRILIWKEMLQHISYEDMGVVTEFCNGSKLTGPTEVSGLWPRKFSPATLTEDDIKDAAARQRPSLTYEQVVFFDEDIAVSVWDQTMDEVAKGDIEGPLELDAVPMHFPMSRRFGIRQGGKIRCVDDFSGSGVNATAQPLESPKPHTLDVLAGLISSTMESCDSSCNWVARSFDLKSAYRQCAVCPESAPFSYIVVGNPLTKTLKAFRMKALPFGSVKSVHSFLRVVASVWAILTNIFCVLSTNYFDDFVSIADARESSNVDHVVKTLFGMLGWKYAQDGPKAPPFADSVTALGVRLNVSNLHQGEVTISNTDSRTQELSHTIQVILQRGSLSRHEALRLRGRMQFASGQLFGRLAKRCLAYVTQHAYGTTSPALGKEAVDALTRYLNFLGDNIPRMLTKAFEVTWFLFTDASFEPMGETPFSGVGAVLVGPSGKKFRFFSAVLSDELLKKMNPSQRKTIIFECEFFTVLCAMYIWCEFLKRCNVVAHMDNDGVRDCLIACHCSSPNAVPILDACIKMESFLEWNVWYTRVPTESNIADDPSRLELGNLLKCGCARDEISCDDIWTQLVERSGEVLHQQHLSPVQKVAADCEDRWNRNQGSKPSGERLDSLVQGNGFEKTLTSNHSKCWKHVMSFTTMFFSQKFTARPQPPCIYWWAKPWAWCSTSSICPRFKKLQQIARIVETEINSLKKHCDPQIGASEVESPGPFHAIWSIRTGPAFSERIWVKLPGKLFSLLVHPGKWSQNCWPQKSGYFCLLNSPLERHFSSFFYLRRRWLIWNSCSWRPPALRLKLGETVAGSENWMKLRYELETICGT